MPDPSPNPSCIQDYQLQLELLKQQDEKRILMARQEQNSRTGSNHGPMPLSSPSTPALRRKTVSVDPVPCPPRSGRKPQAARYFEAESTCVETSLFSHHRTAGYGAMERNPRPAITPSKIPRLANGASEARESLILLSQAAAREDERSGQDWMPVPTSSGATLLVAAPRVSKGLDFGVTMPKREKLPSTTLLGENEYLSPAMKEERFTPISNPSANSADHGFTDLEAAEREQRASMRWGRASSIVKNIGIVLVWLALIACVAYISAFIFWYGDGGETGNGWLGMS